MTAKVKKTYGIQLKQRRPVKPVQVFLAGSDGDQIFRSAVKRVIETHTDVLKALAKR